MNKIIIVLSIVTAMNLIFSCFSLSRASVGELNKAIESYRNKDFNEAAINFYQALKDPSLVRYHSHIRLFLANSLFKLNFPSAAKLILEELVDKGVEEGYYQIAIKKLIVISQLQKDYKQFAFLMKKIQPDNYPPVYENLIKFRLSVDYIEEGKVDESIAILSTIPEWSPFHGRAKYLIGILYYQKEEYRKSIENFRYLAEEVGFGKDMELEDQTFLALGRIFYGLGSYENAYKIYSKIPRNSRAWADSLFESTWTLFMLGDYNKALGNLLTLYSPYFKDRFFHEMRVIESIIYFNLCLFEKAKEKVEIFHKEYSAFKEKLKSIIEIYKNDPIRLAEYICSKDFTSNIDMRIVNKIKSDKRFSKKIYYVKALEAELERLKKQSALFRVSPLGDFVLLNIEKSLNLAKDDLGKMTLKVISKLYEDIISFSTQADLVKFEAINREKEKIESSSEESIEIERNLDEFSKNIEGKIKNRSSKYYYFPFEGEFWVDELGNYTYTYKRVCELKNNNLSK